MKSGFTSGQNAIIDSRITHCNITNSIVNIDTIIGQLVLLNNTLAYNVVQYGSVVQVFNVYSGAFYAFSSNEFVNNDAMSGAVLNFLEVSLIDIQLTSNQFFGNTAQCVVYVRLKYIWEDTALSVASSQFIQNRVSCVINLVEVSGDS